MKKTKPLEKPVANILSGHVIRAVVPGSTNNQEVKVTWEDLTECDIEPWGDWGTFYKVNTNEKTCIKFSYQNKNDQSSMIENIYKLDSIDIKSPILVSERERTPWFIDFHDQELNFCVRCKFDRRGLPHSVRVFQDNLHQN